MGRKKVRKRRTFGKVEQLPSGSYRASYVGLDERRHKAPHTFGAEMDADAWLATVRADISRGVWVNPDAAKAEKFGVYAETYIEQRVTGRGATLRPKTAAGYRHQLGMGLATFSEMPLDDITPAAVRTWHVERCKTAKTAAASEARLLRAVLNVAIEDGIIAKNPVHPKFTKSSAGKTYRPPTLEELAVLHAHVEARFKLGVLLAAYGGLRISEWRALRRSDLASDGERYSVNVTRQAQHITGSGWVVGPPKGEGVRVVTLPSHLTKTIEAHLSEHAAEGPDGLLFPPLGTSQFIHDSSFNTSWRVAQEAAKVKGEVREHDLRDFAGSHLLDVGANVIEVRDFLGHSDERVTMKHYLHAVNPRQGELADRMPELPAVTRIPATD